MCLATGSLILLVCASWVQWLVQTLGTTQVGTIVRVLSVLCICYLRLDLWRGLRSLQWRELCNLRSTHEHLSDEDLQFANGDGSFLRRVGVCKGCHVFIALYLFIIALSFIIWVVVA